MRGVEMGEDEDHTNHADAANGDEVDAGDDAADAVVGNIDAYDQDADANTGAGSGSGSADAGVIY